MPCALNSLAQLHCHQPSLWRASPCCTCLQEAAKEHDSCINNLHTSLKQDVDLTLTDDPVSMNHLPAFLGYWGQGLSGVPASESYFYSLHPTAASGSGPGVACTAAHLTFRPGLISGAHQAALHTLATLCVGCIWHPALTAASSSFDGTYKSRQHREYSKKNTKIVESVS